MSAAVGIPVVAALVAVTAFLAACETVVTRVGVVRALRLAEEERPGAGQLLWIAEHPARGLNVLLLLTIATRVTAATVLAVTLASAALGVAAALLVVASFVLAEVAPRTFTLRHLDRVGPRLAPVIAALARGLRPVTRVLVDVGGRVAGRGAAGPFASDEELRRLMEPAGETEEEGEIEDEERAMIHSVLELGDTVCREIMVPRPDMVSVSTAASLAEVVETVVTSGYSRIPVWEGTRDDVVGVVYAKDVLQRLSRRGQGPSRADWRDLVREATFVPESKRADELLRDLQRQKVHLALVVDEHGALVGLVTIEDILEEIVGEIVDEHDHEEPPVVRLDERRLRLSARVTVHDLNELIGTDLPEEEGWDTVGGLLIGLLGRVPAPGESVTVDGVTLVAEQVRGRRVEKVLLTVGPESPVIRDDVEAVG